MRHKQPQVLISCSLSAVGGNETHVLSLAELLIERQIEVTVATRTNDFARKYRTRLNSKSVRLVTTPFSTASPGLLRNLWAALFWFRMMPVGPFTHLIGIGPGGFHRILKRNLGAQGIAVYWEAGDGLRGRTTAQAKMLDVMDKIAATSAPVARRVGEYYSREVGILPPLTQGVNLGGRIVSHSHHREPIRVSFLGRVSRLKGVDTLIDIWPELNAGPIRLDLYGGGDELDEMIGLVTARGLTDSIYVHGTYDRARDLDQIMRSSDMLVLPSLTEGLPHVLIESMAYGVPFVATNVGGIRDLAIGNSDVMVVEPSRDGVIHGIREMVAAIRNDDICPDRLRRYYEGNFAPQIVGDRWLDFLELAEL